MDTLISGNSIIERFNMTINRCHWLLESIKPVHICLIDEKDRMLTSFNFGMEERILSQDRIHSLQDMGFRIQEQHLEDKKLQVACTAKFEEKPAYVLEYILMTYKLENAADPVPNKGWQKILSLRDVLLHLLYQSDFSRNLDHIGRLPYTL